MYIGLIKIIYFKIKLLVYRIYGFLGILLLFKSWSELCDNFTRWNCLNNNSTHNHANNKSIILLLRWFLYLTLFLLALPAVPRSMLWQHALWQCRNSYLPSHPLHDQQYYKQHTSISKLQSICSIHISVQHHWPGWPTDPDSNLNQTCMWPSLFKIEAWAKAHISGMTTWFCGV